MGKTSPFVFVTVFSLCLVIFISIVACTIAANCLSKKDSKCAMSAGATGSTFCCVTLSMICAIYHFTKGP